MCIISSSLLTMTFTETASISPTEYPTSLLTVIIFLFQAAQLISNSNWEQLFLTPLTACVRLHGGTICSKGFGTVLRDLKNGVSVQKWVFTSFGFSRSSLWAWRAAQESCASVIVGRVLGLQLEAGCAQLPNLIVNWILPFILYFWWWILLGNMD